MKRLLIKLCVFNLLLIFWVDVNAQNDSLIIDSLKNVLQTQKEDTNKVNTLLRLGHEFINSNNPFAFQVNEKALKLATKLNFENGKGKAYYLTGDAYYFIQSNNIEAIKNYYEALKHYELSANKKYSARMYGMIAAVYSDQGNYEDAIKNMFLALKITKEIQDSVDIAFMLGTIGFTYAQSGKYKESAEYVNTAWEIYHELGEEKFPIQVIANYENNAFLDEKKGLAALSSNDTSSARKMFEQSMQNYYSALKISKRIKSQFAIGEIYLNLGRLLVNIKKYAKAKDFLIKGLELTRQFGSFGDLSDGYKSLSTVDSVQGNYKQAFKNYKIYIQSHDSLTSINAKKKSLQTSMQYEFDKKEAIAKAVQDKKDAEAKRKKNQQYLAIAALGVVILAVLIIALIQFRNNKQKQKANLILESTLTNLKSTQAQLIQSEKMASLGELTAGIAHEIQNPLNFVNNFSEVNKELLAEMKDEMNKGNIDDANAIANDVIENEQKINHHGKRADAIVKGMLQHSRTTSSQKEPTNINALADEYLRLSYQGLRAKDKAFNATLQTDFDESIGKINIITQDIGRVLLNLYNNAFYAVNEKKKQSGDGYEPSILVSTKRINDKIEIRVKDNGNGIPKKVVDKIFQPFFTTKPTGQGTGLGLSLSYDIIKAHGGEIKVETKEGVGSVFVIQLLDNTNQ